MANDMTNSTDDTTYTTVSTSRTSADVVETILIGESPGGRTRKVLRATIVKKDAAPDHRLDVELRFEHRASMAEPWIEADHLNLTSLRDDEWVRYRMNSAETAALMESLRHLDAIAEYGPQYGTNKWRVVGADALVVPGKEGEALGRLLKNQDWDDLYALIQEEPNLSDFVADRRMQQVRQQAVRDFESHLATDDWDEDDWQDFLTGQEWMFGLGVAYHFITPIQKSRPNFGGQDFTGKGQVQGDVLARTGGDTSFTVLVEVKLPSAQLVTSAKYRNHVHELGDELVHGVSQIHLQCDEWASAARDMRNDKFRNESVFTTLPRGVLLIGNTSSLREDIDRATVFERYRRNLQNPEILTYDELLNRAKYVVGRIDPQRPTTS